MTKQLHKSHEQENVAKDEKGHDWVRVSVPPNNGREEVHWLALVCGPCQLLAQQQLKLQLQASVRPAVLVHEENCACKYMLTRQ